MDEGQKPSIKISILSAEPLLETTSIPPELLKACQEITNNPQPNKRHVGSLADTLNTLTSDTSYEANQVFNSLRTFSETALLQTARNQTIVPGIMANPSEIFLQEEPRSCSVANFRSITNDFAKKRYAEAQIRSALIKSKLSTPSSIAKGFNDYDYRDLIRLLNSNCFAESLTEVKTVQAFEFVACNFNDLGSLVAQVKKRSYQKVYVACLIESQSGVKDGIHEVILSEVTPDEVVFHDPSNLPGKGGSDKRISKKSFLSHWSQTAFSGYCVAVK